MYVDGYHLTHFLPIFQTKSMYNGSEMTDSTLIVYLAVIAWLLYIFLAGDGDD